MPDEIDFNEDEGRKGARRRRYKGQFRTAVLGDRFFNEFKTKWSDAAAERAAQAFWEFVSQPHLDEVSPHDNVVKLVNEAKTSIADVVFTYYRNSKDECVIVHAYIDSNDDDGGDEGGGGPGLAGGAALVPMAVAECAAIARFVDDAADRRVASWTRFVESKAQFLFIALVGKLFDRPDKDRRVAFQERLAELCSTELGGDDLNLAESGRGLEFVVLGRDLAAKDYKSFRFIGDPIPFGAADRWIDTDLECRRDVLNTRFDCQRAQDVFISYHSPDNEQKHSTSGAFSANRNLEMFFDLHVIRLATGAWMFGFELGRRHDSGDLVAYCQYATKPDGKIKLGNVRTLLPRRTPAGRLRAVIRRRAAP